MSTQLQLRRGTTAQVAAAVGSPGELFVDTDTWTVYLMDGTTSGGHPVGGGGGSSLTVTDGTNTVTGTTSLTFSGGTVSGSTPNATVTISGGGTPGGYNGDIQYNSGGVFAGSGDFTYNGGFLQFGASSGSSVGQGGITAGSRAATGQGVSLVIQGGPSTSSYEVAGQVVISGGYDGDGPNSSSGQGWLYLITADASAGSNNSTGNIYLIPGTADGYGNSGRVHIYGGGASTTNGGDVYIQGGSNGSTANGGGVHILGGTGDNSNGSIEISTAGSVYPTPAQISIFSQAEMLLGSNTSIQVGQNSINPIAFFGATPTIGQSAIGSPPTLTGVYATDYTAIQTWLNALYTMVSGLGLTT